MPEHPPCLTPILKHKSSVRSDLILFKCFSALSVREIAGISPPVVGAAETYKELKYEFSKRYVQEKLKTKKLEDNMWISHKFFLSSISTIISNHK